MLVTVSVMGGGLQRNHRDKNGNGGKGKKSKPSRTRKKEIVENIRAKLLVTIFSTEKIWGSWERGPRIREKLADLKFGHLPKSEKRVMHTIFRPPFGKSQLSMDKREKSYKGGGLTWGLGGVQDVMEAYPGEEDFRLVDLLTKNLHPEAATNVGYGKQGEK